MSFAAVSRFFQSLRSDLLVWNKVPLLTAFYNIHKKVNVKLTTDDNLAFAKRACIFHTYFCHSLFRNQKSIFHSIVHLVANWLKLACWLACKPTDSKLKSDKNSLVMTVRASGHICSSSSPKNAAKTENPFTTSIWE